MFLRGCSGTDVPLASYSDCGGGRGRKQNGRRSGSDGMRFGVAHCLAVYQKTLKVCVGAQLPDPAFSTCRRKLALILYKRSSRKSDSSPSNPPESRGIAPNSRNRLEIGTFRWGTPPREPPIRENLRYLGYLTLAGAVKIKYIRKKTGRHRGFGRFR